MENIKYFLSEYTIHENNTTWYSVYEFLNDQNLAKFIGNLNITHRYFMKGEPFLTTCIPCDNDKILVGVNRKECTDFNVSSDIYSSLFNEIKNTIYKVSNNSTIKSYGSSNEEIHCF